MSHSLVINGKQFLPSTGEAGRQVEAEFDNIWTRLTSWKHDKVHKFTKAELHARLLRFGLIFGVCLTVLAILAVMAIARRRHGSVGAAYKAFRSSLALQRERARDCFHRAYSRIAGDDEDDEDIDIETWPQMSRGRDGGLSEKDRLREIDRLRRKLEALQDQYAGKDWDQDASELKADIEAQLYRLQAPDRKGEAAGKPKENTGTHSKDEQRALFEIQLREFQRHHQEDATTLSWMSCLTTLFQKLKMPVSVVLFLAYVFTCVGVPLYAAGTATCSNGYPWEYHMPFFAVFMLIKVWELLLFAYDDSVPGQLSFFDFAMKFGSSFLGFLDGYSDAVSVAIAHSCSSELWYWMAGCFFFGVFCMQWVVVAILSLWLDTSGSCFYKLMHMDALAMCCQMAPDDDYAIYVWRLVNIARTLFEDLPQSILQVLFVVYVKKNYFMIVSILVGALTSMLAVYSSIKRAVEASGTDFDKLALVAKFNAAFDRNDYSEFSRACDDAKGGSMEASELTEMWQRAGETFDLPAWRAYYNPTDSAPTDQLKEILDKHAAAHRNSESYDKARRADDFGETCAAERQKANLRRERNKSSDAFRRGDYNDGRHTKALYDDRRRTVEWAMKAQEDREARIKAMLVEAPGFCVGSVRPVP